MHDIAARVSRGADGTLDITYTVHAELERLRVPRPGSQQVAHGLWQHTCFELFIKRHGASEYHEFNFSPSRAWAAYGFEHYRAGAPLGDQGLAPNVTVRQCDQELALGAAVRVGLLSPLHASACLSLAISAVIEDIEGALSYWALRHPPGKPDFHHPHGYAVEIC